MSQLIDVDVFRAEHKMAEKCADCKRDKKWECDKQMYSARDICGWLDDAETVDAQPVRTAQLIRETDRERHWHCSRCGKVFGLAALMYKYCPECGAKIDEG